MDLPTRNYQSVEFHGSLYLCHRVSGWEYFPMPIRVEEAELAAGRFEHFDRDPHRYTAAVPYSRTGERSFAHLVEWASGHAQRWHFAISRRSETEVSVEFSFNDPIAAVEFALLFG